MRSFQMKDTGMTTMQVKKFNKNKVYSYIYNERTTCKLNIAQNLQMGLSTVTQNLKMLEEEGLIQKNGYFDSTGGRKADALEIVTTARIAIGVGILKKTIHIVAIDLYGDLIHSQIYPLLFEANEQYYMNMGNCIDNFISIHGLDTETILGVSIATQGIISKDGQRVSYGAILDNTIMKLDNLQQYISYPCRLEHDSKAAANLELWNHKDIQNAIVFLLNPNLGGAIIANSTVQEGDRMHSGIIEHHIINENGPLCYCGRNGCLETYCSVNALEHAAGVSVPELFQQIDADNQSLSDIWNTYLTHLAKSISNLSVVIDGKYIISGYLAPFFRPYDVTYLLEQINSHALFQMKESDIIISQKGQFTQSIGTALYYINDFLKHI